MGVLNVYIKEPLHIFEETSYQIQPLCLSIYLKTVLSSIELVFSDTPSTTFIKIWGPEHKILLLTNTQVIQVLYFPSKPTNFASFFLLLSVVLDTLVLQIADLCFNT